MTQLNIKVEPVGTDMANITWLAQMVDDIGIPTRTYQGRGKTKDEAVAVLQKLYQQELTQLAEAVKQQQVIDANKTKATVVKVDW